MLKGQEDFGESLSWITDDNRIPQHVGDEFDTRAYLVWLRPLPGDVQ